MGAATGGKVMQFGRRKAHFLICLAGLIGVGLTLLEDFEV